MKSDAILILSCIMLITIMQTHCASIYVPTTTAPTYIYDLWGVTSQYADVIPMMNTWVVTGFINPTNRISYCSDTSWLLLGGPNMMTSTGTMSKLYTGLASHNIIYFNLPIAFNGVWQNVDWFSLSFDDRGPFRFAPGATVASKWSTTCTSMGGGSNVNSYETNIIGKVFHSRSNVTVRIAWSFTGTGSPGPSFGIKDLTMLFGTIQSGDTEGAKINFGNVNIANSTACNSGYYYNTGSGNCQSCTSPCRDCFGASNTQCYSPNWNGYFDGTIAYAGANTPNCNTPYGTGSSQCLWCASGYSLRPDGSCGSCTAPYVQFGDGQFHICLVPCTSSQYMAWNNTCIDHCNSALISGTDSHGKTCSYPCGLSPDVYLYWNGSCLPTCTFYPRIENYYQFCDVCPRGYYRYDNGDCRISCPTGFNLTNIGDSLFCSCNSSLYSYWDGLCSSTCTSPLIPANIGGKGYCYYPCSTTQYLYTDGTCDNVCAFPFSITIFKSRNFCNSPCSSTQYLYSDATCASSCSPSMTTATVHSTNLCLPTCNSDYFIYWDTSCRSNCKFPLQKTTIRLSQYCNYPCLITEYLLSNGSCTTNCTSPNNIRVASGRNFCDQPCPTDTYFFSDGVCGSVCPSPMMIVYTQNTKSCIWPCSKPTPYYYPTDATCKSSCAAPYQIQSGDYGDTCMLVLSAQDKKEVASAVATTNTGNTVATVGLTTATFISGSNPTAVTGAALADMLVYMRYINISRSSRLEATFVGFQASSGVIDTQQTSLSNKTKDKFREDSPPTMFDNYNISSVFLINFWAGIVSLLIISGVVLAIMVVNWKISRLNINKPLVKKLSLLLKDNVQNYLVSQFYNCYGDIIMFACLEFRSYQFNSALSVLSLLSAILFIVLGFVILILHVLLLRKYQRVRREEEEDGNKTEKKLEELKVKTKGVKTLYEDFKDNSIIQQGFLMFLIVRSMLFGLFLVLLYNYPLAQMILLTIMAIVFLGYVLILRPFDDILDQIQQVFFELINVIVTISLLYIAALDHQGNKNETKIYNVGELFIKVNMLAQFVPTGFLVVKLVQKTREYYIKFKNRKKGKVFNVGSGTETAKVTPLDLPPDILLVDRKQSLQSARGSSARNNPASPTSDDFSLIQIENSEARPDEESLILERKTSTTDTKKGKGAPKMSIFKQHHIEKLSHGIGSSEDTNIPMLNPLSSPNILSPAGSTLNSPTNFKGNIIEKSPTDLNPYKNIVSEDDIATPKHIVIDDVDKKDPTTLNENSETRPEEESLAVKKKITPGRIKKKKVAPKISISKPNHLEQLPQGLGGPEDTNIPMIDLQNSPDLMLPANNLSLNSNPQEKDFNEDLPEIAKNTKVDDVVKRDTVTLEVPLGLVEIETPKRVDKKRMSTRAGKLGKNNNINKDAPQSNV